MQVVSLHTTSSWWTLFSTSAYLTPSQELIMAPTIFTMPLYQIGWLVKTKKNGSSITQCLSLFSCNATHLTLDMPNLHRVPNPRAKILPNDVVISLTKSGGKTLRSRCHDSIGLPCRDVHDGCTSGHLRAVRWGSSNMSTRVPVFASLKTSTVYMSKPSNFFLGGAPRPWRTIAISSYYSR